MPTNPDPVTMQVRAARVRLVLFDVDGVLTDGTVLFHADGSESKRFNIRDGIAMVWTERAGLTVGLLSARFSPTTTHRAAQLGIRLVHQGVADKLDAYGLILQQTGLDDVAVAYMADDILDLPVLRRVGLATAPADAAREVRERVHWVSPSPGGGGAARELLELILRAQGRWDPIVATFSGEESRA
jgi:3-deoxy-D-manno-octulosonate 8-phosphate phosphatase (KDO 8-P phosphatase)